MTTAYYDSPLFWVTDKDGTVTALDATEEGFKKITPKKGEAKRDVQKRLVRDGSDVGAFGEKHEVIALEKDHAIFRGEWSTSKYKFRSYTVLRKSGAALKLQRFVFRDATPEQEEALLKAVQPLFETSRGLTLAASSK